MSSLETKSHPRNLYFLAYGGGRTSHHVISYRPDILCHGTGNVLSKANTQVSHTPRAWVVHWNEVSSVDRGRHLPVAQTPPPSLYTIKGNYADNGEVTWEQPVLRSIKTLQCGWIITILQECPKIPPRWCERLIASFHNCLIAVVR